MEGSNINIISFEIDEETQAVKYIKINLPISNGAILDSDTII